jgi:Protein of unknown function (DUF2961)/Glycosyl hydrolases family 32 N-terminal domain
MINTIRLIKSNFSTVILILCGCWIINLSSAFGQEILYDDLIRKIYDLEALSLLPEGSEKYSQITIESTDPDLLKENDKYVLADLKGPGVLSKMWVAAPGEGKISVYLDGNETPVIDHSFYDLARLWGRDYGNLFYRTGKSINFLIPITFQKSCRILAEEKWGEVCQFGYLRLSDENRLPEFMNKLGTEEKNSLKKADNILGQRGLLSSETSLNSITEKIEIRIKPGETVKIYDFKGTGAISSLKVSLELGKLVPSTLLRSGRLNPEEIRGREREIPDNSNDRDVLRELLLSIYWDKEKSPAVLTPLGDFFGSAPGWNVYGSYLAGVTPEILYANWFMPFKTAALITLRNDGTKERLLDFEITRVPLNKPVDHYGRFHAKWHREKYQTEDKKTDDNWTVLNIRGKGRFCGSVIDIYNPKGKWWGDCHYSFIVDKEEEPSLQGNGLDVYYNTWGNNFFSEAFHAHSVIDRSMVHMVHESLNRWHVSDNIPFQESLKINFRKLFPPSDSVLYTTTLFWYSDKGSNTDASDISLADRTNYPRVLSDFGITNCYEGEDMEILSCTGGKITPLYIEGLHTGGWSGMRGKQQLLWYGIKQGDTLSLSVPVNVKDEYKLRIKYIRGIDHGDFKVYFDDQMIDESLDLSYDHLAPLGPVDYGLHNLEKGQHCLKIIASEGSPAYEGKQFGLDFLQLEAWKGDRDPKPKELRITTGEFTNFFKRFNINDHCFIQADDGTWHFYGIGGSSGFAHGTSDNLRSIGWTQAEYPFPVEWSPYREMQLWAPHVVKHNDLYYMFYCAGAKVGSQYQMHLATSPDLKTWKRHEENPLFIDGFDARDPMVLRVGDEWVIYYCANTDPRGGNHVVAYRKSKDLVHWGERKIAFVDPRRHKAGGGTESPFVVRRGNIYYLLIGPREGYVGTDIFASGDPFNWYLEDRVGHIDSHAAEVVRDADGKWYVSHSGVGEGGLYLAPIEWNDGLDDAEASQ